MYECHLFELRDEELNVEKNIAIKDATSAFTRKESRSSST